VNKIEGEYMPSFMIRKFTSDDIPQIMALQQKYQRVYPSATVIPGEVYLSSGFDGSENIFCAFDEEECLRGYAPLFPNLTQDPQIPHTVWAEVKVDPDLTSPQGIRDLLFEQVVNRTGEIAQAFPGHETRLTFQYHPSEISSIEYVMSRGCSYTESVFRMMRNLSQELPVVPPLNQIDIRSWRMESEREQQAYIQARNEAFPEAPITLADWQSFLSSPAWQQGTTITAFDGPELVGSVTVYWDEVISQQIKRKAGFTEYIFVRAKWRKRGIAAVLICQGLIYLKEHGREAAYLEVKASNQHALDLYYRLGYQLIDESRLYILEL
jgi:ribosomal protein S18 acetylase RimI-like enzyme